MWLALDADGVLQKGTHLGCLLPELPLSIPIAELEKPFLTMPGFARKLEEWTIHNDAQQFASLISSRHYSIKVDTGVIEEVNVWRTKFDGIILATNQVEERLTSMLKQYPPNFFDIIVASCAIGYAKPDPRYFAALCRSTESPPSSVTFLDDRLENVIAAEQSGLQARHFRRLGGRREMRRLIGSLVGRV